MPQGPALLITRPEPDAQLTAHRMHAIGLHAVLAPLLEMHLLPAQLPDSQLLGAIAFTSANAIRAMQQTNQFDALLHLPVFCVGDRTADFATAAGFENVTSANGDFGDLVSLLSKQEFNQAVFYPTAAHVSGDLAQALSPFNLPVLCLPIYEMRAVKSLPPDVVAMLKSDEISAVSLYSRRTAEIFCSLVDDVLSKRSRTKITALCLSENVAAPMITHHFNRVCLADYPSEEAMMALALSFARDQIRQ